MKYDVVVEIVQAELVAAVRPKCLSVESPEHGNLRSIKRGCS
jgi:hypothetical protein